MNPRVKSVFPNDDYTLCIEFTNGEVGAYDCRPLLEFGVFVELKDLTYFKLVKAYNGTVVWPHEQDICPDTVYLDAVNKHVGIASSSPGSIGSLRRPGQTTT